MLMDLNLHEAEIIRQLRLTADEKRSETLARRQQSLDSMPSQSRDEILRQVQLSENERRVDCLLKQKAAIEEELKLSDLKSAVEKLTTRAQLK